jgi:hypothetical protein
LPTIFIDGLTDFHVTTTNMSDEHFQHVIESCAYVVKTQVNVMKPIMKNLKFFIPVLFLSLAIPLHAEEKKPIVNASDGIKEILTSNMGKRITVKTDSGEAIEGTVVMVGYQLVHLEKLTGKDFYDSVICIDKITSVTIKVRGN